MQPEDVYKLLSQGILDILGPEHLVSSPEDESFTLRRLYVEVPPSSSILASIS